jgi:hypothetical protein
MRDDVEFGKELRAADLAPSFRSWRNIANRSAFVLGKEPLRILTTGSRCCARAASGHATAAPPISVMNARRFTRSPRRRVLGTILGS